MAVNGGLHVVLSNPRGPETLTGLVAELRRRARATTPAQAASCSQRYLGESAYVVKAFNNIHHQHLAVLHRPQGAEDRTALPIAGDNTEAKRHASELLDTLGYDTVDAGPLAQGRRFAPGTPAYGAPYTELPSDSLNSLPPGPAPAEFLSLKPGPAPTAEIRALLTKGQTHTGGTA